MSRAGVSPETHVSRIGGTAARRGECSEGRSTKKLKERRSLLCIPMIKGASPWHWHWERTSPPKHHR